MNEKNNKVELIAIGIGHDVSRYYSKAVTIMDVDQLGEVLLNQLSSIFSIKKLTIQPLNFSYFQNYHFQ